jgi:hypothetical protein
MLWAKGVTGRVSWKPAPFSSVSYAVSYMHAWMGFTVPVACNALTLGSWSSWAPWEALRREGLRGDERSMAAREHQADGQAARTPVQDISWAKLARSGDAEALGATRAGAGMPRHMALGSGCSPEPVTAMQLTCRPSSSMATMGWSASRTLFGPLVPPLALERAPLGPWLCWLYEVYERHGFGFGRSVSMDMENAWRGGHAARAAPGHCAYAGYRHTRTTRLASTLPLARSRAEGQVFTALHAAVSAPRRARWLGPAAPMRPQGLTPLTSHSTHPTHPCAAFAPAQ